MLNYEMNYFSNVKFYYDTNSISSKYLENLYKISYNFVDYKIRTSSMRVFEKNFKMQMQKLINTYFDKSIQSQNYIVKIKQVKIENNDEQTIYIDKTVDSDELLVNLLKNSSNIVSILPKF